MAGKRAAVRYSGRAKADLLTIGRYTLQTWNPRQAERYLAALEQCAKLLAVNPLLGRPCEWIRPGLHRFEKAHHVLFYRPLEDGILVVRILHRSMMPSEQPYEENPGA